MYAIIETGGKQFKVAVGDAINVEKLDIDIGMNFTFDRVLGLVDGEETVFGKPLIDGATVNASVLAIGKGKKLIIYKHKSKKGFHKKKGHRQPYTRLKIESINRP